MRLSITDILDRADELYILAQRAGRTFNMESPPPPLRLPDGELNPLPGEQRMPSRQVKAIAEAIVEAINDHP